MKVLVVFILMCTDDVIVLECHISGPLMSKKTVSMTFPANGWNLNFLRWAEENTCFLLSLQLLLYFKGGGTMPHCPSRSITETHSPLFSSNTNAAAIVPYACRL